MQLNKQTQKLPIGNNFTPEQQFKRAVMSCLLWENEFYEDGQSIADRISELIPKINPQICFNTAIEARKKLRHIPLLIAAEMTKYDTHKGYVSSLLNQIIQRPDELTEYLAIYWRNGKRPISKQSKKGLAQAFTRFNEYQLAKYNRTKKEIKLIDIFNLVHPKAKNDEQWKVWQRLITDTLETPDTWEVSLSNNDNLSKKDKWTRLLLEDRLGALALLRNLRNMIQENVNEDLIKNKLGVTKTDKILPFRFISAAKHAPQFEQELEQLMFDCLKDHNKLSGKTVLLIDVSGSMEDKISQKSEISRLEAACALAMLCREICEDVNIYTFSNNIIFIPSRHGFALRDAIVSSQYHMGTDMERAINYVNEKESYNRLIVFTDEINTSYYRIPNPIAKGYIMNVASYNIGIDYGSWIKLNGFSENLIRWISEFEKENF